LSKHYTISGNITYPITLDQAKKQLKIDPLVDHENDRITEIIAEAFGYAKDYLERIIIEQDIVIETSSFISEVESEFSPINAITSIEYKDENGATQTLDVALYQLYSKNMYDSYLHYEPDLPDLLYDDRAVKITGKVGYKVGEIPKRILSAVNLVIGYLDKHRDDSPDQKERASQTLLRPYKQW